MVEADPRYPDARAAAVLISHLNKLLPAIELDHEPLIEEAERIEEQVRQMMEATTDTKGPDKPSSMLYGWFSGHNEPHNEQNNTRPNWKRICNIFW